jgi:hypothetical protein
MTQTTTPHTKERTMNDTILRAVKNAKISEMILNEVARTGSVKLAIDSVLGEGRYDQIASDLYDQFNAE